MIGLIVPIIRIDEEIRTAHSVFIGSRDFIQISRHSIKQSIYFGFAFAGTSRFPATSTTCKFAGIYSNSSRLGKTRERGEGGGRRREIDIEKGRSLGGWSLGIRWYSYENV